MDALHPAERSHDRMGNADNRFRNSILDDDGIAPLIPSSRLPNNTRQGSDRRS